jgi:hypothetical protein
MVFPDRFEGTQMQRSRLVAGIAVAAAVGVGGVGGALIGVPGLSGASQFPKTAVPIAATGTTDANAKGARPGPGSPLIDAAAKALNLTTQQLLTKLSDGTTTIADVAKQQNVDINTVIAAMTNADKDRIGDIVNKPWPKFGARGPATGVPGGPARPGIGGFGGFGRFGAGITLDPLAKALGISPADLKADLAKGQSIADIAKAKNVDVNKVIDTLVADAKARIQQAVTNKKLTQAQADKLEAGLKTEITNLVNNGFPKGPMGGFGFGGRFRGHGPRTGMHGPESGSSPSSSPTTTTPTS